MPAPYEATWESLDRHDVPAWYEDAKLGIFIHWYPNAVPGYGFGWYAHNMHLEDHEIHEYHRTRYGAPTAEMADEDEVVFEYRDFVRDTDHAIDPEATENFEAEHFDPDEWAALFDESGARYVVPVAEHHDGFPMWPASFTEWNAQNMGPRVDVIGSLCEAVRSRGMKFAGSNHRMYCYYDHRYDGLFGHPDYDGPVELETDAADGPGESFVTEWLDSMYEMFDHHQPDLLWLDGDWGATADTYRSKELLAEYYNRAALDWGKEVVANDRLGRVRWKGPNDPHGDFFTPEYTKFDAIVRHKWEANRSLGDAWTYDHTETDDDLLSVTELVRNFVDIVSKNGNMLINIGPRPDGTIPEIQAARLRGIGKWLDRYGEGIYGSRHWVISEDTTDSIQVRYTAKNEWVYAFLFGWPTEEIRLSIPRYVDMDPSYAVHLLGTDENSRCEWERDGDCLVVTPPPTPPGWESKHPAYLLRVQVAPDGGDAYEQADGPSAAIIETVEELRRRVEDDYDESTWEL